MNNIKLYSVNNNEFEMQGTKKESILDLSILIPGYIITPTGDFVIVDQKRYHKEVFDEYLNKYLEKEIVTNDTIDAIRKLVFNNHVVYCGVRTERINTGIMNSDHGIGYIFTPEIDEISSNQKDAILDLLNTNVSKISKRKVLDITFATMNDEQEYCEENFIEKMNIKKTK